MCPSASPSRTNARAGGGGQLAPGEYASMAARELSKVSPSPPSPY